MIKQKKPKKCKGYSQAKGRGCGDKKYIYRYGLCRDCFIAWCMETVEGQVYFKKNSLIQHKKLKTEKRKENKKKKQAVKTKSEYEKILEKEVNAIVRLIDFELGCISCNHGWKEIWHRRKCACHRLSVGSHPELRYNFFNIFMGCPICNSWKGGNEREYDKGLIAHHGIDVLKEAKSLTARFKSLHLSKEDLKEKIVIARKIKKEILNGKDYTRTQLNNTLKIYHSS